MVFLVKAEKPADASDQHGKICGLEANTPVAFSQLVQECFGDLFDARLAGFDMAAGDNGLARMRMRS